LRQGALSIGAHFSSALLRIYIFPTWIVTQIFHTKNHQSDRGRKSSCSGSEWSKRNEARRYLIHTT